MASVVLGRVWRLNCSDNVMHDHGAAERTVRRQTERRSRRSV